MVLSTGRFDINYGANLSNKINFLQITQTSLFVRIITKPEIHERVLHERSNLRGNRGRP